MMVFCVWRSAPYHSLILFDVNLVAENDLRDERCQTYWSCHPLVAGRLTKGKFGGSRGDAWIRNSSLQLSRASKLLALLTS